MDASIKSEINCCIRQLYSIANELEDAANEVRRSISGMNTSRYTNTLEDCARKHRRAANNLEKIQ